MGQLYANSPVFPVSISVPTSAVDFASQKGRHLSVVVQFSTVASQSHARRCRMLEDADIELTRHVPQACYRCPLKLLSSRSAMKHNISMLWASTGMIG